MTTAADHAEDTGGSAAHASSAQPLRVKLYVRLPFHLRLDVWPFAIVYAGLVGLARRVTSDAFETGLIVGIGFLLHALAALSTQWSVGSQKRGKGVEGFLSSTSVAVVLFLFSFSFFCL